MDDPATQTPAGQPDPPAELARLRRRAARLVAGFAALAVVWLAALIAATRLDDPTATAVPLAVSVAAVAAMAVLVVVLLRLAARVRGIHRHARNPPR